MGYPPVGVPTRPGVRGYPRWGTLPRQDTPSWGTPWPGLMGGPPVRIPPDGVPLCLDLAGVPPPHLDLAGVPPRLDLAQVIPHLDLAGVLPHLDLARVPPPTWTWLGYPPPPPGPGSGTPPPPLGVDRQNDGWTHTCQNITFPRTTYAVGNKCARGSSHTISFCAIG